MKKIALLLLFVTTRTISQNYFPLQVGNSWTYCSSNDTVTKRIYLIKDTIKIGDKKYYLYGMQNFDSDTIRSGVDGNVWKLTNGKDIPWFDFTKDSGDVYTVPRHGTYICSVKVRTHLTIHTHRGNFTNCVDLFFNIPQIIDDEIGYTFAPEVGPIRQYGAWTDNLLYSAVINNTPVFVSNSTENIPVLFSLFQNYPNPFNPATIISYALPFRTHATISVVNAIGQKVADLVNQEKDAGFHNVTFDASGLASGIYLYRLQAGSFVQTRKLVVLK